MPQVAITIGHRDGIPTLLADTRTPADEQRRQLHALKVPGAEYPEFDRIDLVQWNTGDNPCWIRPASAAPVATQKPITKKEKSK